MMTTEDTKTSKQLQVHCLSCDGVFIENLDIIIELCPHCGNADMMNTVYIQQEESDDVRIT